LIPAAGIPALVIAGGLALLLPQLAAVAGLGSWHWIRLGLVVFGICFVAGQLVPGRYLALAKAGPVPPVVYRLDADDGRAYWTTAPGAQDVAAGFFGAGGREIPSSEFFPPVHSGSALLMPAQAAALPAPELQVIADETTGSARTLRLRARGPLGGQLLRLYFSPEAGVTEVHVNGAAVPPEVLAQYNQAGDWPWLPCLAPPAGGFEVSLTVPAGTPLKVYITERVAGFAPLAGAGLELPAGAGETFTLVSKSFEL
jgi:hypothetical protein